MTKLQTFFITDAVLSKLVRLTITKFFRLVAYPRNTPPRVGSYRAANRKYQTMLKKESEANALAYFGTASVTDKKVDVFLNQILACRRSIGPSAATTLRPRTRVK